MLNIYRRASEVVEVDTDDWKKGEGDTVLACTAGPCTVMAARYPSLEVGYLVHAAEPTIFFMPFQDMVDQARADGDIEDLIVTFAGDSPIKQYRRLTDKEAVAHRETLRTELIRRIVALGVRPENIETRWSKKATDAIDACLDCATGEFTIETQTTRAGAHYID